MRSLITLGMYQVLIIEKQRQEITGEPQNLEEQAIRLIGRDIYEKLVIGYTEKQRGRDCKDLPSFIIQRLPVRMRYDNNYFNHPYQGIPVGGYTKMVENMLDGIEVRLGVDYLEHRDERNKLADQETGVIFGGRLAEYKYYDMDKVILRVLEVSKQYL